MNLDVPQLRSHFPSLESGIAHFDAPGGTQTPREVGSAVAATLTGPLSNRGAMVLSERNADTAVADFRRAYGDLLGVDGDCVVYGRSATQLTFDFSRAIARAWSRGDNVVVSRLDHDCNVRPWVIAAERAEVEVRWLDFDPETAELDLSSLASLIDERTRVVAVTAASNVLGTKPPVRVVAEAAHAVGALVYVDAVHYAAHELVDVPALGADLLVCSPYKFLGPHCAVLAARSADLLQALHPDKLAPSTDRVPERFELGTLPYEIMAGATAAVDFLAGIAPGEAQTGRERLARSWEAVHAHESQLRSMIEDGLARLGDRVVVHSRAASRTPTLLLTFPGRSVTEVSRSLAARDVFAPAGSFYAYEPFRRLSLDDDCGLRVGLAPYNDPSDVARLLDGLQDFLAH